MKKEQDFKRKCENLAHQINSKCQTFVPEIRYREFLHNVYYEKGVCYCDNLSERRLESSDIEICRYKNRIKVTMVIGTCVCLTKKQKKAINKILCTNVQYKDLRIGYAELSFNVNPHKM